MREKIYQISKERKFIERELSKHEITFSKANDKSSSKYQKMKKKRNWVGKKLKEVAKKLNGKLKKQFS